MTNCHDQQLQVTCKYYFTVGVSSIQVYAFMYGSVHALHACMYNWLTVGVSSLQVYSFMYGSVHACMYNQSIKEYKLLYLLEATVNLIVFTESFTEGLTLPMCCLGWIHTGPDSGSDWNRDFSTGFTLRRLTLWFDVWFEPLLLSSGSEFVHQVRDCWL